MIKQQQLRAAKMREEAARRRREKIDAAMAQLQSITTRAERLVAQQKLAPALHLWLDATLLLVNTETRYRESIESLALHYPIGWT